MKITRFYRNTNLPARQLEHVVECVSNCRRHDLGSDWRIDRQEHLLHYPPIVVNCDSAHEVIGTVESRGPTTKHVTRLQTRSGRVLQLDTTDPFFIRLDVSNRSRSAPLADRIAELLQLAPLPQNALVTHGPGSLSSRVRQFLASDRGLDLRIRELPFQSLDEFARRLSPEAEHCSYAILVADDELPPETANDWLAFQLGFFQARYGLGRVCLVHSEDGAVPYSLDRLTYVAVSSDASDSRGLKRLRQALRWAFPEPDAETSHLLTTSAE